MCDSYNHCNDLNIEQQVKCCEELYKESWPSTVLNKDISFDYKMVFVTELMSCLYTGFSCELQANDQHKYLQAITDILSSGQCNYAGERIRLPSVLTGLFWNKNLHHIMIRSCLITFNLGSPWV